jgi:predicted small lipoprotein YifL
MSLRARVATLAAALAVAAVAGCGQQGPLVLPSDARPIERVEPPPAPDEDEDEPTDDERTDER